MSRYVYLGDRLTDPRLIGLGCDPVYRPDGKCIVGRKPRNQLVRFEDGTEAVVLARRLRVRKEATPTVPPLTPDRADAVTRSTP